MYTIKSLLRQFHVFAAFLIFVTAIYPLGLIGAEMKHGPGSVSQYVVVVPAREKERVSSRFTATVNKQIINAKQASYWLMQNQIEILAVGPTSQFSF